MYSYVSGPARLRYSYTNVLVLLSMLGYRNENYGERGAVQGEKCTHDNNVNAGAFCTSCGRQVMFRRNLTSSSIKLEMDLTEHEPHDSVNPNSSTSHLLLALSNHVTGGF